MVLQVNRISLSPMRKLRMRSVADRGSVRAKSQSRSASVTQPGHRYHREILERIKRGDAAGAQEMMRQHLQLHAEVKSYSLPNTSRHEPPSSDTHQQ